MDSINSVQCSICIESKCEKIKLTCGHAFGRSCMRKWVESSNQKNCCICRKPLTDNDIKEIKNIPLLERAVIVAEKAIKICGRTVSETSPYFALSAGITTVLHGPVSAVGVVGVGAVGAAAGAVGAAFGATEGACVAAGGVAGGAVGAFGAFGDFGDFGDFGAIFGTAIGAGIGGVAGSSAHYEQKMNPVVA